MKKIIGKLFGSGLIKEIGDVADKFITTKQEKDEFMALLEEKRHDYETEAKKLQLADVADARAREIALRNTIGVWVMNMAAALTIIAFLGLLYVVVLNPVQMDDKQASLANVLLGSLGTIVISIFNYWFGSSDGSRRKDDIKT